QTTSTAAAARKGRGVQERGTSAMARRTRSNGTVQDESASGNAGRGGHGAAGNSRTVPQRGRLSAMQAASMATTITRAAATRDPRTARRLNASGMRPPRRGGEQLYLLGSDERTELHGEAFDEVRVGEDGFPVRASVGVVVELPEVDELIDRAGIGLEVANELLGLPALLECRIAELGIELDRLTHLADVQGVRPELVDRHHVLQE